MVGLYVMELYMACFTLLNCPGAHTVKAGWSFEKNPRFIIPPVMSRYRDRKLNKACQFVGYDAYVDATTRGQMRYAFDPGTSIVGNWDVMEGVLDYLFLKLGVDGENGGVDRPIVMTEPIANLTYPRRSMFWQRFSAKQSLLILSSDERDSVRMLLRSVRCVRHRLSVFLPI